MLSQRQQEVLKAIVLDYIASAEPVGSRTISKKYNLGVSSATIRNEMADLEDAGFIHQPHTSAGRVPTDAGYRFFVEDCMPAFLLERDDEDGTFDAWVANGHANDELMRHELLRVLAKTSSYTAFLVLETEKGADDPVLALLNLQYLAPGRVLMIVVNDDEQVRNEIIEVSLSVTAQDLAMVNGLLNHYLRGLPAKYWAAPLSEFLYTQEGYLARFIKDVVHRIGDILAVDDDKKVYVEGALNMLDQPEFQDIEKMRALLAILNHEEEFASLFGQEDLQSVSVRIGAAAGTFGENDCSLIIHHYHIGKQIGHLGLIGPKRMDYVSSAKLLQRAVTLIEKTFGDRTMLVPERQTDLAPLLNSFAWQLRDINGSF